MRPGQLPTHTISSSSNSTLHSAPRRSGTAGSGSSGGRGHGDLFSIEPFFLQPLMPKITPLIGGDYRGPLEMPSTPPNHAMEIICAYMNGAYDQPSPWSPPRIFRDTNGRLQLRPESSPPVPLAQQVVALNRLWDRRRWDGIGPVSGDTFMPPGSNRIVFDGIDFRHEDGYPPRPEQPTTGTGPGRWRSARDGSPSPIMLNNLDGSQYFQYVAVVHLDVEHVILHPHEKCEEKCPICLDNCTGDVVRIKKCKHMFHRKCLLEAAENSDRCPMCRAQFTFERA